MIPSLDVFKCNAEKKYAGELAFGFEGDDGWIDIPYVRFSAPLRAALRYEILEGDVVELTGTLTFTLKGACSRCLKETERTFTEDVEGYFVPRGAKAEAEDYRYENGVIDLHEFMRDAALFSMPARLLCGENCSAPDYQEEKR